MAKKPALWKKARGKLGMFAPLIGTWKAKADSPIGPIECVRTFSHALGGNYIQLRAQYQFPQGTYEELAIIGAGDDGVVSFWSFTSDGKRSTGKQSDVSDVHPEAIGFEAQMPAGLARMAYWPDESGGFYWVVEARNKKGWKRFSEHHYSAAAPLISA
jgi:hypothetical protein